MTSKSSGDLIYWYEVFFWICVLHKEFIGMLFYFPCNWQICYTAAKTKLYQTYQ